MTDAFLKVDNLARRYSAPQGGEPLTVFEQVNF